ncbi:penicillin-binding protein activator [Massilia sp. TWR1-2-2]|uniref:penicillin-binding protein activator n=1 Tax=Massilia sp. TWR1-2-2 TaxID=2804584 RepID=UPI003CF7C1BB
MPIKSLKGLFAALAGITMLSLGGCSTPCELPGRSCAPVESYSAVPPPARAVDRPRADAVLPPPAARPEPAAPMQTMPVEPPDAAPAAKRAVRIGLMLPLRSAALGTPADALRAGFMAAWERDRAGFTVNLIDTGDSPQETLDAYVGALRQNDIVVGPLARSAVTALATSALVTKPTIALNHPEATARAVTLPAQMLVIGLSIEDEARQVAKWAASEHPGGAALIVSGASAWQRRIANSFAAQWKQLGYKSQTIVLADSNGYLNEAALGQLRTQITTTPPTFVFTALDPSQAGQVRGAVGADLPAYGTSSVNPGPDASIAELDGMRLLDMPWQVQPSHQAVMVYPRWLGTTRTLDMDRLYALGIDAFRVAREIAQRPGADFVLDGVTGRLSVSFGRGQARFERVQPAAVYQGGGYTLVPDGR